MRKIYLAAALLFAVPGLVACETVPNVAVCEQTVQDERSLIAANLAYKSFRKTVEVGVVSGFIKPGSALAIKIADADNVAFAALQKADIAYRTCSGDIGAALAGANRAISDAVATIPVNTDSRREQ